MKPPTDYDILDSLFKSSDAAVVIFRNEQILYANPSCAQLFAFQSTDELISQPINRLLLKGAPSNAAKENPVLGVSAIGQQFPLGAELSTISLSDGPAIMAIVSKDDKRINDYEQLLLRANYDSLTGLPNRHLLYDRLQHALTKASRQGNLLALMFIDLVQFKSVNDTLGHNAGDVLLKKIALRLTSVTRSSDTVARLAGDEFVVILEEIPSAETAAAVASKIVNKFSQPVQLKNHKIRIGVSVGIVLFPQDGMTLEVLMQRADEAMYQAKATGSSCFKFYSSAENCQSAGLRCIKA